MPYVPAFSSVLGHSGAKQMLEHAMHVPRHGYLIAGPSGVGCHVLAEAFVRGLVDHAEPAPLDSHPDIVLLEREPAESGKGLKKEISIKAVRELRMRMSEQPIRAKRCVAYIPDADTINEEGANALLKSVEEPVAGAVFVFVAHDPSRLPETLRSRLVLIYLQRVADREIRTWLQERDPMCSAHGVEDAIAYADGCPGTAWRYMTDESFRNMFADANHCIESLCRAESVGEALAAIADTVARCDRAEDTVTEWRNAIQYWQAILRRKFIEFPDRSYQLARVLLIAERRIGGPVSPRLWIELGLAHIFDGRRIPEPSFVSSRFPYSIECGM